MTGKAHLSHQVTPLAQGSKRSSVINKRHGSQSGPQTPNTNKGPLSPPTKTAGPSSPFTYASAVANRSKAPISDSPECELYKALAVKAREHPRILSIKLQRPPASSKEPEKALSQADWGELLFNSCGIDPADIKGVDYQAGGALNCEVMLTDNANLANYVGKSGNFKNYTFNSLGPAESEVLITFKGVPLEVPDVEIIWLLKTYGYKPSEDGVFHSPIPVISPDPEVSCRASVSSTRSIRATPPASRRLRGFYFWAGLQEADTPRRVTVEHKGRGPRQCPHCLKTAFDTFPCPFNAKGSACKRHGAKRTSLAQYSKVLREQAGYQTLRQIMLSSPASDLDQELDQESDQPPAQLELEEKEEDDEWDDNLSSAEEVPSLPQAKSWADEPSSLDPLLAEEPLEDQEPAGEPLEQQVATLTKSSQRSRMLPTRQPLMPVNAYPGQSLRPVKTGASSARTGYTA